jgi:hypothetical protein
MSQQILNALISGGAGLVGAAIGFLGSAYTARSTGEAAHRQRRYDLAYDKRAEILPVIHGDLTELYDRYREALGPPLKVKEDQEDEFDIEGLAEQLEQLEELGKHLSDIKIYFREHRLWLPKQAKSLTFDAFRILDEQLRILVTRRVQANQAWEEALNKASEEAVDEAETGAQVPSIAMGHLGQNHLQATKTVVDTLNTAQSEFCNWLDKAGKPRLNELALVYENILGIEDEKPPY